MTSLDAFWKAHGLPDIDVLKIDVEGAEGAVWAGMRELLAVRRVHWIMMEIWPERSWPEAGLRQRLADEVAQAGFGVYRIEEPSGRLVPATIAQLPQLCAHGRGYTNLFFRRTEAGR